MKKEKKEKVSKSYIIANQISDWLSNNEVDTSDAVEAMGKLIGLAIGITAEYEEIENITKEVYKEILESAYYSYRKSQAN